MVTAGEHEVALRCKLLTEANSIKTGMEMRGSDLTKNNLKRGTRRGKKERKKMTHDKKERRESPKNGRGVGKKKRMLLK